jgi:hydroxyethylthiazole kinase-like uncharacterized protein yjeF
MTPLPQKILPDDIAAHWLYDTAASRSIEVAALHQARPFSLMDKAGRAAAQVALAMAPHARCFRIAAGPGNNGGDGLVAALALRQAGKSVQVSLLGDVSKAPADARQALSAAQAAGVKFDTAPLDDTVTCDFAIDALLGLGQSRAPDGTVAAAVRWLNALQVPVLALDLPTGLCADTGQALGADVVRAHATLSLLTLKPGLFTGQGRDLAGQVWWSGLDVAASIIDQASPPSARLTCATDASPALRQHAAHKGSFGDVWVVGGAPGMGGAIRLAGAAALAAGAGRVYVCRLDGHADIDPLHPELMHRGVADLRTGALLDNATVVCGCGGGDAVRAVLPLLLHRAARLVLDADALNALASDPALLQSLQARAARCQATIATPHPLEAARLLAVSTADVQADRLRMARTLARRLNATVVLKGSGTVVCGPATVPVINSSGNARLATGGTGDVLAGWLGGLWAPLPNTDPQAQAHRAATAAVWLHGRAAELDQRPGAMSQPLPARSLIQAMTQAAMSLT